MAKVRFVSVDYLYKNTIIEGNVGSDILLPIIDKAQLIYIEGVLGTALYDKIKTDVTNNSLSGDYLTLMTGYIQPALAEWIIYESYPHIWSRITNKTVSTSSSDNAIPLTSDDVKFLREGVRDSAEYLTKRITRWLQSYPELYPEYLNPGSKLKDVKPKRNNLFGGVYIRKRGGLNGDCAFGMDLNVND
jgi:hypothetical protein